MITQTEKSDLSSAAGQALAMLGGWVPDGVQIPPAGNLAARSTAPGAFRLITFDTDYPIDSTANTGLTSATSGIRPYRDSVVKCEGTDTLRFDRPPMSPPNAAGTFYANFADDLSKQFGDEGEEYFVQCRFKWNQAQYDTVFLDTAGNKQGGVKFFDVVAGDQAVHPIYGDKVRFYTSSEAKIVIQTYYQNRFPIMYAYDYFTNNSGFYEPVSVPLDFKLENALPACTYNAARATGSVGAVPGCFNIIPETWFTLQFGETMGPVGTDVNGHRIWQSRIRLWGAQEGQASQLLIDWKPGVNGYFGHRASCQETLHGTLLPVKMGKLFVFPFNTAQSPTQVHDLCQVWAGPIIISTQQIADPI